MRIICCCFVYYNATRQRPDANPWASILPSDRAITLSGGKYRIWLDEEGAEDATGSMIAVNSQRAEKPQEDGSKTDGSESSNRKKV